METDIRFEIRSDLCGGEAVIRGTRVTLRTLLTSLAEGHGGEAMPTAPLGAEQ